MWAMGKGLNKNTKILYTAKYLSVIGRIFYGIKVTDTFSCFRFQQKSTTLQGSKTLDTPNYISFLSNKFKYPHVTDIKQSILEYLKVYTVTFYFSTFFIMITKLVQTSIGCFVFLNMNCTLPDL